MNEKIQVLLVDCEFGRQVSIRLKMVGVAPKRLGSQNGPIEGSVAVLDWNLDNESEKVGFSIGL